ncbi:hypothetical protein CKO24_11945 [Rhodothalassium salexigens DSM 2132]|nr:hypothetical protein [Rhodothalassium salexigens DSM 2132]
MAVVGMAPAAAAALPATVGAVAFAPAADPPGSGAPSPTASNAPGTPKSPELILGLDDHRAVATGLLLELEALNSSAVDWRMPGSGVPAVPDTPDDLDAPVDLDALVRALEAPRAPQSPVAVDADLTATVHRALDAMRAAFAEAEAARRAAMAEAAEALERSRAEREAGLTAMRRALDRIKGSDWVDLDRVRAELARQKAERARTLADVERDMAQVRRALRQAHAELAKERAELLDQLGIGGALPATPVEPPHRPARPDDRH